MRIDTMRAFVWVGAVTVIMGCGSSEEDVALMVDEQTADKDQGVSPLEHADWVEIVPEVGVWPKEEIGRIPVGFKSERHWGDLYNLRLAEDGTPIYNVTLRNGKEVVVWGERVGRPYEWITHLGFAENTPLYVAKQGHHCSVIHGTQIIYSYATRECSWDDWDNACEQNDRCMGYDCCDALEVARDLSDYPPPDDDVELAFDSTTWILRGRLSSDWGNVGIEKMVEEEVSFESFSTGFGIAPVFFGGSPLKFRGIPIESLVKDGQCFVVWGNERSGPYDVVFALHVTANTIEFGAQRGRQLLRVARQLD